MTSAAHARGRGFTRNLLLSATRGAVLIGLAVVIGIVLLQIVDDSGGGGGGGGGGGTSLTTPGTGATTTTASGGGGETKPPQEVTVQVLNGSGISGAAATRTNDMRAKGYQMLPAGNASVRTGTAVQCKPGFEEEAQALVAALSSVGVANATVEPFPSPPPAGSEQLNCIVVLGQ